MASGLLNSLTFLDTPAESRNAWASKTSFGVDFLLGLMFLVLAICRIKHPFIAKQEHYDRSKNGARFLVYHSHDAKRIFVFGVVEKSAKPVVTAEGLSYGGSR